jgi:hypothetical protein
MKMEDQKRDLADIQKEEALREELNMIKMKKVVCFKEKVRHEDQKIRK